MVSCSNDTTVRIWRLSNFDDYVGNSVQKGGVKTVKPFSTLDDHNDYVRRLDYSKETGRLFTASDSGQICLWDLLAERIVQKYNVADEQNL